MDLATRTTERMLQTRLELSSLAAVGFESTAVASFATRAYAFAGT